MNPRVVKVKFPNTDYEIHVVGAQHTPLRDFYHLVLRLRWPATFGLLAGFYLAVNALFALAYLATGGLDAPHDGSFASAFYFSIQTMGTIGYGAITPISTAANLIVVLESITGLILTALATGIVFAKFSRPYARIVFTRDVVISPHDGALTLSFRIGNERGNQIIDAQMRLIMTRTEKTKEGKTFYRTYDLKLVRDHMLTLSRSATVLHVVDETSPLHGATAESLRTQEVEIGALVVGLDDTSGQLLHGRQQWTASNIKLGMRHVDVLSEPSPEILQLDLRKFHDLEPA